MTGDHQTLRDRWNRACGPAGDPLASRAVFDALINAYTGPDRHYHGLPHIEECLREFDVHRHLAVDPQLLELAIWFHDVVYDGRRPDNEARSADVADAALGQIGFAVSSRDEVRRLIMFTRHTDSPTDTDGKLLVDIDLASLAAPPEVFDQNTRNIRREFAHLTDEAFASGRVAILSQFLSRPRVYFTDALAALYETQARANLTRVIGSLRR